MIYFVNCIDCIHRDVCYVEDCSHFCKYKDEWHCKQCCNYYDQFGCKYLLTKEEAIKKWSKELKNEKPTE